MDIITMLILSKILFRLDKKIIVFLYFFNNQQIKLLLVNYAYLFVLTSNKYNTRIRKIYGIKYNNINKELEYEEKLFKAKLKIKT